MRTRGENLCSKCFLENELRRKSKSNKVDAAYLLTRFIFPEWEFLTGEPMPDHESRLCKLAAFPYVKDDTRLLLAGTVSCPTQRRSIVGSELAVQGVGLFHLLKIQRNSHTVNDDQTLRDQVLIRDVIGRKTVQGRERADEFHGFGGGTAGGNRN